MNLKPINFFLLLFAFLAGIFCANAQGRDTLNQRKDSVLKKNDTIKKRNGDTAILKNYIGQKPLKKESVQSEQNNGKNETIPSIGGSSSIGSLSDMDTISEPTAETDTSLFNSQKELSQPGSSLLNTNRITDRVLAGNKFINSKDRGTYFLQEIRTFSGKEFTFYLLCILLFILALFKTFYPMYFNNLFRIFFNTSLRQTQLTDQLSQAKFPSFVLNIFFTLSGGIYLWLLFQHLNRVQSIHSHTLLIICILSVAVIYLIKFIILKFTGWLAGIKSTIDNYIFVIFLVNKIMGILLIPFLVLLAFSMNVWIPSIAVVSGLFIGLLFLSRYAKSYGALEKRLNINSFHLLLFVLGAEIIPLFIFYKIAVDYLV